MHAFANMPDFQETNIDLKIYILIIIIRAANIFFFASKCVKCNECVAV